MDLEPIWSLDQPPTVLLPKLKTGTFSFREPTNTNKRIFLHVKVFMGKPVKIKSTLCRRHEVVAARFDLFFCRQSCMRINPISRLPPAKSSYRRPRPVSMGNLLSVNRPSCNFAESNAFPIRKSLKDVQIIYSESSFRLTIAHFITLYFHIRFGRTVTLCRIGYRRLILFLGLVSKNSNTLWQRSQMSSVFFDLFLKFFD